MAQISRAVSLGRTFVARVAPWFPLALFVFSIGYYASYAFSGLDLGGEGGTIAVIADRIRFGAKPYVDTFLGYNLLWFYPIVWLFQIFGSNFTVVRLFFFALSVGMGLSAYRTVLRATRRPLLSLATGVILVLIPGIQFRNYLPFFGVVDLMVILEAFALPQNNRRTRVVWIFAASLLVSITFLIRIDLGLFFSVVYFGSAIAFVFLGPDLWPARLQALLVGVLFLPITFAALHLPIGAYARTRGFDNEFWAQYTGEFIDLEDRLSHLLPAAAEKPNPGTTEITPASGSLLQLVSVSLPNPKNAQRTTRPLPRWTEMFTSRWGKTRILVFLTYYPLVAGLIMGGATLVFACGCLAESARRKQTTSSRPAGTDALILGIALASAFTLFPQYFFFRPDPQHISEMMCVFLIALACSCGVVLDHFGTSPRWLRPLFVTWIALTLLSVYLYCDYGLSKPWMGSIARKQRGEVWFTGDNGVSALLPAAEAKETRQLYDLIKAHSSPDDYVTCFPYAPTVNFMTGRRSYLYNLYLDNVNRPADFDTKAIADIEKYKPAAILVEDDPMNVVDDSRFSVWAAPTLAYIEQHYHYAGTFRRNDVYLAPDK